MQNKYICFLNSKSKEINYRQKIKQEVISYLQEKSW